MTKMSEPSVGISICPQTHLCCFSRASLSQHEHDPVFFDNLDDLLLVFMHRQGASKTVQL